MSCWISSSNYILGYNDIYNINLWFLLGYFLHIWVWYHTICYSLTKRVISFHASLPAFGDSFESCWAMCVCPPLSKTRGPEPFLSCIHNGRIQWHHCPRNRCERGILRCCSFLCFNNVLCTNPWNIVKQCHLNDFFPFDKGRLCWVPYGFRQCVFVSMGSHLNQCCRSRTW